MSPMHRHRIYTLCAVVALCGAAIVVVAGPGRSQQAPAPTQEALKGAIMQLQQQLVEAWLDVANELANDPLLLERGGEEREKLLARAEGLQMVRHQLLTALAPPRPEAERRPMPGRFQFVEWDQEPGWYWVLDTVSGGLDRRRAPQP